MGLCMIRVLPGGPALVIRRPIVSLMLANIASPTGALRLPHMNVRGLASDMRLLNQQGDF